jgi:hypothetical protein
MTADLSCPYMDIHLCNDYRRLEDGNNAGLVDFDLADQDMHLCRSAVHPTCSIYKGIKRQQKRDFDPKTSLYHVEIAGPGVK